MIKKLKQKNVKECDKRNSHISSKLHMIYVSTNNGRHPVTFLSCRVFLYLLNPYSAAVMYCTLPSG